ncbi:MAG: hypothetical protein C4318_04220 [Acidimicrobiia bacterium]
MKQSTTRPVNCNSTVANSPGPSCGSQLFVFRKRFWTWLATFAFLTLSIVVSSIAAEWADYFRSKRRIFFRAQRGASSEDGSIGEWVMILVMAVGITLFIWAIAQPMLGSILTRALSKLFR